MKKRGLALTTLILAGGLGTRLKSVLNESPKILATVAGTPFIDFVFTYLVKQGIYDVILCTGYEAEQVSNYCQDGSQWGLQIRYSIERDALGTGGAVKNAAPMINSDPFIVMNGDSLAQAEIEHILDFHTKKQALITISLSDVQERGRFGAIELDVDGSIREFNEKEEDGEGLINTGLYVISKDALELFPIGKSSFENDLFPYFIGKGLYGKDISESFIDIGTPEAYALAQLFFAK